MPKISVCLAVYKTKPEYLQECIDSILAQTFTDFELLIVDDCPQDEKCEKIINSYKDERIKYYRNEQNLGISGTRNRLLDMAQGEYIAVMDHDDISLPTRFEKQAVYLDAHPECGVVSCWYQRFPDIKIKKKPENHKQIVKSLMNSCPLLHPASMIRKRVLKDNDIIYESQYSPAEDYALWCRLADKTQFHNIQEVLFLYRDHLSNESKRASRQMTKASQEIKENILRKNRICRLIEEKKVISFDIFDTLLLRPYRKPEDLFELIEKEYQISGFATARKNAEKDFYAQNGKAKEANLDDIYSVLPQYKQFKQVELDLEYSGLILNKEMKEIYDYAKSRNKIVIITSDMYLPYDFVEKVLKRQHIEGYKKLYLSNQVNKRKDNGELYTHILQDLKIKPYEMLHIGDNLKSDYKNAKKMGISSYLYENSQKKFNKKDKQIKYFLKKTQNSLFSSVVSSLISQKIQTSDYWENFGYKYAGPIVYAYANFIRKVAEEEKLKKILFIARDGYIAQKVFNMISSIETNYIYAPRILNYTANLDFDYSKEKQAKIVCDYFHQNVGKLKANKFFEQHFDMFKNLAKTEKLKTGYTKYIEQICGKNKKIGTVDTISEQLSGQRLIEKEAQIKTTGFYISTNLRKKNDSKYYNFVSDKNKIRLTYDNKSDLIEFIFSAPENPIITMKDGQPLYQSNLTQAEHIRQDICKRMEKGVINFVSDMQNRLCGLNLTEDDNDILALIEAYVNNPTKKDMIAMCDVKKSPLADNSIYVPLFAAKTHFWNIKQNKKLVWLTPLQRFVICLFFPITIKTKGLKMIKIHLFPKLRTKILKISYAGKYEFAIGNPND